MKKKAKRLEYVSAVVTADKAVVSEIRNLIEAARGSVAAHANTELTML